ncbi:hypothetical protein SmJEL517_g00360 [Synchytrium microbalum]|uniref:Transcriptional regulatory protein n=1 Tax=Synchytrium microbalum TaxID=1806994 RepID=A0A507CG73_9FUNG|nr:uncharacterized protein SmJEL517_g00360 [Synchytrium microbalum]TPX38368.1 hypothetical protein SmJEL517_g00360 [Synchytrium microbalum]
MSYSLGARLSRIRVGASLIQCHHPMHKLTQTNSFHSSISLGSGHNKWSKIRHQKGDNDFQKSQILGRISKQITASIRAAKGNTDPKTNILLASAIYLAKKANVPKLNIENAIKRASGPSDEAEPEYVVYEGLGKNSVAILVEALTSNRKRTMMFVRLAFKDYGNGYGNVAYMFAKKGRILFTEPSTTMTPEELFDKATNDCIESDLIEDLEPGEDDGTVAAICDFNNFILVKQFLESKQYEVKEFEGVYIPNSESMVDIADTKELEVLLDKLEGLDDVVAVYHNARIPET